MLSKSSIDESEITTEDKETQTYQFGGPTRFTSIEKVLDIRIYSDVFSILMDHCNILDSVQIRVLSVAIYMLLRFLNIPLSQ